TTRTSKGSPTSARTSAAGSTVGQSESEPIMSPTRGAVISFLYIFLLVRPRSIHEEVSGQTCIATGCFHVLTCEVDMANLTAWTMFLAIQVNFCSRDAACDFRCAFCHRHRRIFFCAYDIFHDSDGGQRGSISQWGIHDRAQVLLKLRGYRTILGPVPSIVRTHRQLIDCDVFFTRVIDNGKELYREHTGNAQLRSDLLTECLRP